MTSTNDTLGNHSPISVRLCRLLAAILALAVVSASLIHEFRWTSAGLVYVSQSGVVPAGFDAAAGVFCSIQEALDQALPGDVIQILPGVYRERLHLRYGGTARHPLTVEAAVPGTVVVHWESDFPEAVQGEVRAEGDGILSFSCRWPIYRLRRGERSLYRVPFGGLTQLRTLIRRPHAHDAFCSEADRVFVWLSGGTQDHWESLVTHGRVAEPREWGELRSANLTITADHVNVHGIDFRMGIGSSILVTKADQLHVEECAFSGANAGVTTLSAGNEGDSISLRHCLYHNYPQFEWRSEWLSWDEVYAGYATSSLIASNLDRIEVEGCAVVHGGDAVRASNQGASSDAHCRLHGNLLVFCTDDAFEVEGPARNVTIDENLVYECHQNLGLSPVERGPVTVHDNVFLHSPDRINGSQLKLINRPGESRIQQILIENNFFTGNWLCWYSGSVRNVTLRNNQFVVSQTAEPRWPDGLADDGNVVVLPEKAGPADQLPESRSRIMAIAEAVEKIRFPDIEKYLPHRTNIRGPAWWDWSGHEATRTAALELRKLQERLNAPKSAD